MNLFFRPLLFFCFSFKTLLFIFVMPIYIYYYRSCSLVPFNRWKKGIIFISDLSIYLCETLLLMNWWHFQHTLGLSFISDDLVWMAMICFMMVVYTYVGTKYGHCFDISFPSWFDVMRKCLQIFFFAIQAEQSHHIKIVYVCVCV